jgi:predicted ABC-type transport system involved in lysophospholipase L1 biosynthesis ATPase subunit
VSTVLALEGVALGPLHGLSLALAPGQSGQLTVTSHDAKNTLFALLAGAHAPDAGTVRLFGQDLYRMPDDARLALLRRVGFVPELGGLISNLKAWENLLLPTAYHQGLDAAAAEARVQALWRAADPHAADLRATLGKLPDRLSAHERRLVALIRAMLPGPELLVYDFLSAGLEAGVAARLYALTERFHREQPGRVSLYLCADDAPSAALPADITRRWG